MTRLPQILVCTVGWLIGLSLAQYTTEPLSILTLLVAGVSFGIVFRFKTRLGYLLLLVSFVVFGLWRGQLALAAEPDSTAGLIGEKVIVTGRVSTEPGWNHDRLYEFVIADIYLEGSPLQGNLKVKTLVGNIREGQTVAVTGKVSRALGTAPAQIWYAETEIIDARQPYPIRLKSFWSQGLARVLPPVEASFVRGLLFGSRVNIPDSLEEAMRRLGLTHIVAVSGYNLTIIVAALSSFIRRQSRVGFILTLGAIVFFVVMTGASAPIVRAAVMAGLFVCIGRARRELDPRTAFAVSIIIMTAWNPMYLYRDIGWQLSVLALAGVLWLTPLFLPRPGKRLLKVRELLAGTLGAYLATAPLIAYTFGTFSIIAPLANLLILPIIPLVMLLGFVACLIGVLYPFAIGLLMPIHWLVSGLLWFVQILASIDWAQIEIAELDVSEYVLAYIVLIFLAVLARKNALPKLLPHLS